MSNPINAISNNVSKRIRVLYTGGTIGMQQSDAGLAPAKGLLPKLLRERLSLPMEVEVFEFEELIDSSAIEPWHWNLMIDKLIAEEDLFDGFVVIHGTDTMAYTASILAFALQGFSRPIVLTGSQLPLIDARSDGWVNLVDALYAASHADFCEVGLVFDRVLLRGVQARKIDCEQFRGFDSPNAEHLANFAIAPKWSVQKFQPRAAQKQYTRLDTSLNIGLFWLSPGAFTAAIGDYLASVDAAVLSCYGSGNIPNNPSLLEGMQRLRAQNKSMIALSQCIKGSVHAGLYAASQPLVQNGVVMGADMTPEAALAKLWVLCSQRLNIEQRTQLIQTNLVGEMN